MNSPVEIITERQNTKNEDPEREQDLLPEPRDTPRHQRSHGILSAPCGPVGKIELRAGRDTAPMASSAAAGGAR